MSESDAETEYRVLARKYRPTNFDDLIGQAPMVRTLSNAFATNRIAQAYMLTGVRGVGKTTTARILARALNFESDDVKQPTLELSELGVHCVGIMEGNHVDVIEMDAASHTGIGDIREIIASVRYKPVSARYKVYIIDEVHMLSNAAFNGLLKTLEEPPEHVKFIFATTEIRKVPVTVLSRCQRFDLRRIEASELAEHLKTIASKEGVNAESDALAMICRAAEGSARDALSLLDQAIAHAAGQGDGTVLAADIRTMLGLADRAKVIDLFENVMAGDITAALAELKSQYNVGADPSTVLTDLAEFLHFVTTVRYVDTALDDPSLSEAEKTRGKQFAETLSPRILGRAWQMLLKGIAEVQSSPRPLAAADMVLVRLTHAADLPTPDDVIRSLNSETGGGAKVPTSSGASPPGKTGGGPAMSDVPPGGGGAELQRVANGPTLVVDHQPFAVAQTEPARNRGAHLKAVPDTAPQHPPAEPSTQQEFERINTFKDLLNVAERKRDIRFKLLLRNNFSEVSFSPEKIEFQPVGNAPRDIVQILDARLYDWTGKRWQIIVSEKEGGATLKETESAEREQNFADAETDPVVAAVLNLFPKSKILDVRFPELDTEGELDVAQAEEAGLENPDDFESPEDSSNSSRGDENDPGAADLEDYFR